jgi:peptidoglycan-associated lipoprotein
MRLILCVVAIALLAGCASGVRLDDVPVEDKSATLVLPEGAAGSSKAGGVLGGSDVAPVVLGRSDNGAVAASDGRTVYFDYDSFVIKPEFQSLIEANARPLLSDRKRRLVIEGHTDERGGREYNLALGQKRAEAVRQALSLLGVQEVQVEAVSFGKEKPAALGTDEASLSKNRRAELSPR